RSRRGDFFRLGEARPSRAADRADRHGGVAEPGAAPALFGARLWQAGARVRHPPATMAGVGRTLPRRAPPRQGLTAVAMAERPHLEWVRERLKASQAVEPRDPAPSLSWLEQRRPAVAFKAQRD